MFSIYRYLIIFHEIKDSYMTPTDFYTLEYLATQIPEQAAWQAALGKIPVNYWLLSKRVIMSLWEKKIPLKGLSFSFALKTPGCVTLLVKLLKTQRGWQKTLHPMFPKCHHLWTGTLTGEGPSLQLVFITHWQELVNTQTPDKKLQPLHKALNTNELLRAACALWACASRNSV